MVSITRVGGEATPPDIQLLAFGDLVQLAREGDTGKRYFYNT